MLAKAIRYSSKTALQILLAYSLKVAFKVGFEINSTSEQPSFAVVVEELRKLG